MALKTGLKFPDDGTVVPHHITLIKCYAIVYAVCAFS